MKTIAVTILGILAALLPAAPTDDKLPAPRLAADIVLRSGKIATLNGKQPEATALAVWRERSLVVGNDADVQPLVGPATRVIDLQGRRVVPGFHDSHVHLLAGGLMLSQVDLKDAADEAEFGRRLREFDRKLPPGRWMLGGNWDHDRAFAGKLPDAAILDKYVPSRPVFIRRYDGHMALVNTKALELAGVTATTPDPAGGVVYRKTGTKEPTGLLRDNAMGLVGRLVPPPDDDAIAAAVQAALVELRRVGITSVQDMAGLDAPTRAKLFRHYQKLKQTGQLTVRIRLYWPLAAWQSLAQLGILVNLGDLWLAIGIFKDFIDGSLGSSTAKMYEPYLNEPGNSGIFVTPRNKLLENIRAADKAGLAVAVHAIGDQGNAELLDIFAEVAKANGSRDRRFRIEHAQHLRPQDYRRFHDLNVIASMQPFHIIDDGRWAEGRIGKERCASSYANRSLLDAGAKLAFGSDWPVAPLSPLLGIDAAVHRRTLEGKHPEGWFPEQKISVKEALEAYTKGSAYAAFRENDLGTLETGKLADLVVLSRDILDPAERERISETDVLMTMVAGRVVWEKK
jgi:predicted amidohydrolase YtcJ